MLKVSMVDYAKIRRHAEEAYPLECCGILVGHFDGDARNAQAMIPCTNAAAGSPQTTYNIAPHELIHAQRQAREQGLEIVGFYHSHPDHDAQPSPTDLEHAHWIGCSYVITSVTKHAVGETNSFLLSGHLEEDKHFVSEEIELQGA